MKTILVPIDYSENSQNIFSYALEIARVTGAEVVLFHAFFPIISPPAAYDVPDVILALEECKTKELEIYAEKAKKVHVQTYCLQTSLLNSAECTQQASDFDGITLRCQAKMGGSYETILKAIDVYKADLVVMGMQEGEAVSQAVFGSTTISVIQESKVPVLAVPQAMRFNGFKTVAFAANLHKLPKNTDLHVLRDFVNTFEAKLQVLHLYRTEEQFQKFEAGDALETLNRNFQDIEFEVSFDLRENVAAGIQYFVKEQQADLLVLIPNRHNFLERLLDKSITGKITAHPMVPLLALPPSFIQPTKPAKDAAILTV